MSRPVDYSLDQAKAEFGHIKGVSLSAHFYAALNVQGRNTGKQRPRLWFHFETEWKHPVTMVPYEGIAVYLNPLRTKFAAECTFRLLKVNGGFLPGYDGLESRDWVGQKGTGNFHFKVPVILEDFLKIVEHLFVREITRDGKKLLQEFTFTKTDFDNNMHGASDFMLQVLANCHLKKWPNSNDEEGNFISFDSIDKDGNCIWDYFGYIWKDGETVGREIANSLHFGGELYAGRVGVEEGNFPPGVERQYWVWRGDMASCKASDKVDFVEEVYGERIDYMKGVEVLKATSTAGDN